jgi:HSP20 family protein
MPAKREELLTMNMRNLIPWGRNTESQAQAVYREGGENPLLALHREVNRLFDDVVRGFDPRLPAAWPLASWSAGWPSVEVSETDKELRVTAELPGLEEKDIEVVLDDDVLILRGERRSETEDKERQYSERFYGRFERRIPLDTEVEQDKVKAAFASGVLTVTLPKSARAQAKSKRIAINGKT